MEENFPTSLLVVAGILRLAGASRSEPWSSHSTDQSFLEGGLVTAKDSLVSVKEDDPEEVTLQLGHLTSDLVNDVSHLHEAKEVTKDGSQVLTVVARQLERSLDAAILDHQSNAPLTSRHLTDTAAESFSPSKHSTQFLPRKEGERNSTGEEYSTSVKQITPIPRKAALTDHLATLLLDTESSENPAKRVILDTSLSLATTSGNTHKLTLVKSKTEPEAHPSESKKTSAKEELQKLLIHTSKSSQHSQMKSQPTKLDVGISSFSSTPSLSTLGQSPYVKVKSSTVSQQQPTSEKHAVVFPRTKSTQQPSFAFSPHREVMEPEPNNFGMTGNPKLLTPSQSNTHPFPLLSTSSLETSTQSAMPGDIYQSHLSKLVYPSQFPAFSKSGMSSTLEVHLHDRINLTLHPEMSLQTTSQVSHYKLPQTSVALKRSLPIFKVQEATVEVSILGDSKPQGSGLLAGLGKPQGSIPSMTVLDNSVPSHGRPIMSAVAASSHAELSSPIMSAVATPAGHIAQALSEFLLLSKYPSVHAQQASPSTMVSSVTGSKPLAVSFALTTKPQTHNILPGPKRPGAAILPHAELQRESEMSVVISASAQTTSPAADHFPQLRAGPNTSFGTESAPSTPTPPILPTLAYGEPQGRLLGKSVPYHVGQQMPSDFSSAHSRLATPIATVPSQVDADVSGTSPVARLNVSSASALDHSKPKLLVEPSSPFYIRTSSLPARIHARLQPASMTSHELPVSTSGVNVPPRATKLQEIGGSGSFTDEPHLVTSVAAHANPKTKAMPEGGLPVHLDATPKLGSTASVSFHAGLESLFLSAHTHTARQPGESVNLEAQLQLLYETQTQKTPPSAPAHLQMAAGPFLGQLKPHSSNSSALIQIESQPQATSTLADPETWVLSKQASVHSTLPHQATSALPRMFHIPVKEDSGKSSPETNLLKFLDDTYRAPLLTASTPHPLRWSPPHFGNPGSQVTHPNEASHPLLSLVHMEENLTQLRTTPVLAGAGTQDGMQKSLGFIKHLSQSDVTIFGNPDFVTASLRMPPLPLPYMSVVQNADNMVCLQPVQESTLFSGERKGNRQAAASPQDMLMLSSFLGFSEVGASSLIQGNPPSVILVKPVFVFIPAEKPDAPVLPSTVKEETKADLSFSNKTVVGWFTPGSGQKTPVETLPTWSTIRNSTKADTPSTNAYLSDKQIISGPVLSAFPKYITGAKQIRPSTLTAGAFPYGLWGLSTRTKILKNKSLDAGFQPFTLDFQESEDNSVWLPVGMSVEHHVSAAPQVMASVQQRPKTLMPTNESLGSLPQITSLNSLMGSSASEVLKSSLQTSKMTDKPQLRTVLMFHSETHPHGSTTPLSSIRKNSEESLSTNSAGNMELPLEIGHHLTPLRSTSHALSTELLGKPSLKSQYIPKVVPSSLTLSTGQKYRESEALNDSYAEAVAVFPMVTERSASYMKSTSKLSKSHPISPKYPVTKERLRSQPFLPSSSADTPIQTVGKHTEDITNHPVVSRSSDGVSLQASTSSYFVKSPLKYSLTTLILSARASFANIGKHPEPTVSTEETYKSARITEIHNETEAMSFTSPVPDTSSGRPSAPLVVTKLSSTSAASSGILRSRDVHREIQKLPLSTIHSLAPSSALEDTGASPMGIEASLLEMTPGDVDSMYASVSATNKAIIFSPSMSKDSLFKRKRGKNARTPFPLASSLHSLPVDLGDHLERHRLLGDAWAQMPGSSLPSPGTAAPSLEASAVRSAPTLLMAALSTSAAVAGIVGQVPNQTSHPKSRPLDTSETFLSLRPQTQPTLKSLSEMSEEAMTEGGVLLDAVGEFSESHSAGEQVTSWNDATKETEDPEDALSPWDSDSSLLDWRRARHQRLLRSDDAFLDGFAVVSDDSCSSGNYSAEMSLRPAAVGTLPPSPNSFLALLVLQDNSSPPLLRVQSCCVTATARPGGPDATCCSPARSPVECRYIQWLQNGKSHMASFTIQPFQMLNRSMAYLHCELSICLRESHTGCEQSCSGSRESKPGARNGYQTLHNVISLGPVLKRQVEFPPGSAAGAVVAVMLSLLLGALAAIILLMGIFIVIGLHRRYRTKMLANLEHQGIYSP